MNYNTISYSIPFFTGNSRLLRGSCDNEDCRISYSCEIFDQDAKLPLHIPEFLGLYFNLGNDLNYKIDGFSPGIIMTNHYNMVYMPETTAELTVQRGKFRAFSIEFAPGCLELITTQFPVINKFMACIEQKLPAMTSAAHLPLTSTMYQIIFEILTTSYKGVSLQNFLKARVFDIMVCCLEQFTLRISEPHQTLTLRKTDVEKIKKAHDFMLENVNKHCTVGLLASVVDLDPTRLARGFKQLFGKTVYNFLMDERMRRARTLLQDTTLSIQEIAAGVGYKKLSNFSEVFKKKFNYSPRAWRQHRPAAGGAEEKI